MFYTKRLSRPEQTLTTFTYKCATGLIHKGCQITFSYGSAEANNHISDSESSASFFCRHHFSAALLSALQLCTHQIRTLFKTAVPPPYNNNGPVWFSVASVWCYTQIIVSEGPQISLVAVTCLDVCRSPVRAPTSAVLLTAKKSKICSKCKLC